MKASLLVLLLSAIELSLLVVSVPNCLYFKPAFGWVSNFPYVNISCIKKTFDPQIVSMNTKTG